MSVNDTGGPIIPDHPAWQAGLEALQAKDYDLAIAHLQIMAEQPPSQLQVKAQVALVKAYVGANQPERAIALCRQLSKSNQQSVQEWANNTLKQLVKRYPPKIPSQSKVKSKVTEVSPLVSSTGFVPFDPLENPATSKTIKSSKPVANKKSNSPPYQKKVTPVSEQNSEQNIITNQSGLPAVNSPDESSDQVNTQIDNQHIEPEIIHSDLSRNDQLNNVDTATEQTAEDSQQSENDVIPWTWQNAERAKGWKKLKTAKLNRLRIELAITAIALIWFIPNYFQLVFRTINDLLVWLPWLNPIQFFYQDHTNTIFICLGILFVALPWLTDVILKVFYGLEDLPQSYLLKKQPETQKLLRNYCQQQKLPVPSLKLLPISSPVIFTYGNLPRFARIAISQGLLDQLTEAEITTLYARELAHIQQRDFIVLSWATLLLQIPYLIYWQSTYWADKSLELPDYRWPPFIPSFFIQTLVFLTQILRVFANIIASFAYGTYWLWRWPLYWVAKQRVNYSDRLSVNLTGNPNALTRALLKITMAISHDVAQQKQTPPILESYDLLLPVNTKQSINIGSVIEQLSLSPIPLLQWDITHPYRQWFLVNHTHPLLGDRLLTLTKYAEYWKLETELNWQLPAPPQKKVGFNIKGWQHFLLQGAPYFGLPIGLASALMFWIVGAILDYVGLWRLSWVFGDLQLLLGILLIGFSLGTFIRINHFFPEGEIGRSLNNPDFHKLLADSQADPLDSQWVQMSGKLIGKPGMANWLGVDLMLQTNTGLVKLHYIAAIGPLRELFPKTTRPSDLIGKPVTVFGWWRKGATAWIDVETMKLKEGRTCYSSHPLFSTLVGCLTAIWGAYIIYRGF
jgi:Zn-dependent protease with chaperone function